MPDPLRLGASVTSSVQKRTSRWVGEFLLIVVGVLVALAADGWNERRRQASEGRAYLEQLHRDTNDNLRILRAVLEYDQIGLASVEAVMRAGIGGRPLSRDSLRVLYLERHLFQVTPLNFLRGTLWTLTNTGGLAYVEDHSVRVAILEYAARIQTGLAEYAETKTRFGDHVYEISAAYQAETGFAEFDTLHEFFVGALAPATIAHLEHIRLARVNMVWSLLQLIEGTEPLAALLSSTLD